MLTALTCEREMLTFPLPARIKTLARDTEHDHTSSSADFILKSIFPSGVWTLDPGQLRMMTTQQKIPSHSETNGRVTKNVRGRILFLILPFSGSGIETNSERQQGPGFDEKQISISKAKALEGVPSV